MQISNELVITENKETIFGRFCVDDNSVETNRPIDMVMQYDKKTKLLSFTNTGDVYNSGQQIPFSKIEEFKTQIQLHGFGVN